MCDSVCWSLSVHMWDIWTVLKALDPRRIDIWLLAKLFMSKMKCIQVIVERCRCVGRNVLRSCTKYISCMGMAGSPSNCASVSVAGVS